MNEETQQHPEAAPRAWPTTAEFMGEETQAESVAFAAYEILCIQAGLIKALMRCHESVIPGGIKAIFDRKIRSAVSQLYGAIPNQVVPMVEWMVMEEQLGGPEAVAKMQAELEAERSGVVDGKVTTIPKIPEQWPVQIGEDNQLHIVPQPEKPLAKVLEFKRPAPSPQDEPPGGGTPVATAMAA